MMTPVQEALRLAEEYALPVFPCRPDKKPYTRDGFKSASTNLNQIEEWFTQYPDALVGVPTGKASRLLVIDVDPKGESWYSENAYQLACGRIHKTPRGHHLLYRMPDADIRCSAGKIAPGVDVRANGGYIIWWPAHRFDPTGGVEDVTEPPTIVTSETPKSNRKANAHAHQNVGNTIIEGGRHDALTRLAGKMRRVGATHHELVAALTAFNARCEPPLPDAEVKEIGASVARLYEPATQSDETAIAHRQIVIKSASELATTVFKAVWLLRPYLEKNASVLMFGDLGTLKSFLALHWALTVALAGHPVIYLSAEGKGLGRRIKGWARDKYGDEWLEKLEQLPFFGIEQPLNLSAHGTVENLLRHIEDGCIELALIVIDTVSKNSDGRVEASTEDATEYLNLIDRELRSRFSACILFVHHTGHAAKDRARGPYALMANTDANFRIDRPYVDSMTITITAGRMKDCEPPAPFSLAARVVQTGDLDEDDKPITTLVLEPTETITAKPKRPTGRAQKMILSDLERRHREGKPPLVWTINELRDIGKEVGINRTSARDAVNAMVESGFLQKTIGGLTLGYKP